MLRSLSFGLSLLLVLFLYGFWVLWFLEFFENLLSLLGSLCTLICMIIFFSIYYILCSVFLYSGSSLWFCHINYNHLQSLCSPSHGQSFPMSGLYLFCPYVKFACLSLNLSISYETFTSHFAHHLSVLCSFPGLWGFFFPAE